MKCVLAWLVLGAAQEVEVVLRVPMSTTDGGEYSLELLAGDEPCSRIVGFCGGDQGCVNEVARHIQPLLHKRWPAKLAIVDDYFCGCQPCDFGLEDREPTPLEAELLTLLAGAIASRDSASPLLHQYNDRRALLPQASRLHHFAAVARFVRSVAVMETGCCRQTLRLWMGSLRPSASRAVKTRYL